MLLNPLPGSFHIPERGIMGEQISKVFLGERALSRNAALEGRYDVGSWRSVDAEDQFLVLRHQRQHFAQIFLAACELMGSRIELGRTPEHRWTLGTKCDSPLERVLCVLNTACRQKGLTEIAPPVGRPGVAPQSFLQGGYDESAIFLVAAGKTIGSVEQQPVGTDEVPADGSLQRRIKAISQIRKVRNIRKKAKDCPQDNCESTHRNHSATARRPRMSRM